MPCLNQAGFLAFAIESVLQQGYPAIELIVIDGGSTDGSVEIIEQYGDHLAHWVSEPDRGQSHALNKGFRLATGDIAGWLNSDDTYAPGTFDRVAEAFTDERVAIAMASEFAMMDAESRIFGSKENSYQDHRTLIRYWTTGGMTINQPSVFFRRDLIRAMDLVLDEGLEYAMDYDLWLRLTRQHPITVVNGLWANYRFHDDSKSGLGFESFFPEWKRVSRRFWGPAGSWEWLCHLTSYAYYRYPLRIWRSLSPRNKQEHREA